MKRLKRIESTFGVLAGAVLGTFLARLRQGKLGGNEWVYLVLTSVFIVTAFFIKRHRKRRESKGG